MAIITFSAPDAGDRGKCFSVGIPAFAKTTPAEAARYLLGAGTARSILRYTWGTVAAVATVIEGLIERITIPYQCDGLGLTTNLKRSASASDNGAENLLREDMSSTLAMMSSRNAVAQIERMTSLGHWLALIHDVFAAANSTSVRTLELTASGNTLEIYPPLFKFFDHIYSDEWQAHTDMIAAFDGYARDYWRHGIWNYRSTLGYLSEGWIDAVDDNWTPWPLVAAVGGIGATTIPNNIQRFNLDLLWAMQGALGCMLAQQARTAVTWLHPHTRTETTYEYTVDVAGGVSSPTVTTSTESIVLPMISYERKVTVATAGTWTDDRGQNGFRATCPAEIALRDPSHAHTYIVKELDDLPDVDLSEIDAEIVPLQAARDAALADYNAARDEVARIQANMDALYTSLASRAIATQTVASQLDTARILPISTETYTPLWWTWWPGDEEPIENREAMLAYKIGSYSSAYAYFSMTDIEAEAPGFCADSVTFLTAQRAYDSANAARREKERIFFQADEALIEAQERRDRLIDQADLSVIADLYNISTDVYQPGYFWTIEFYGDDPFDSPHPPTPITLNIKVSLQQPTETPRAIITNSWPSADAFAGGYVGRQRVAVGERYDDDVHLYEGATDDDGREYWRARRTPPSNPTRWRARRRDSSANPSASVAQTLAGEIAQAAQTSAQSIVTPAFGVMPTPIGVTAAPWSQPERGTAIAAGLDSLRSVRLIFSRYRSKQLKDSTFAGWRSDEGDLYLPYRIICDGGLIWEYDNPIIEFNGEVGYSAHSQKASAPTFSESFELRHSECAAIGVEWKWKSMPCVATT